MAIEYFPNRPVERPNTRIKIDSSALRGSASTSEKPIMLVGPAQGGKPNTVYKIRNIYQAQSVFRGGELLDAMELAWNASNETPSGGEIYAMRVEDAKPATLTKGGIVFQSELYGEEANELTIALETITLVGQETRQLTVEFPADDYRQVYRNIGDLFEIEAEAPYQITVAEGKMTVIADPEGVNSKHELTLGAGGAQNVNSLINTLNSFEGLQATAVIGSNKNVSALSIDDFEVTLAEGDKHRVTGLLADLYRQLLFDPYVSLDIPQDKIIRGELGDTDLIVVNNVEIGDFSTEALTGGTTGQIPTSWSNKFKEFANEGGYYLVPLTDDQAVHAEASAFVNERYDNGEPMRAIVGGGYDETVNQMLGRASAIRNPRTMFVGFSGRRTMSDGRVVEVPAYMSAALVAGLASGLEVGESVTFKEINITNLSTIFEGSQMDALNAGGVVMAEYVRNNLATKFRIVDDVTTYNDPSDPVRNQMAVGEGNDFLASELKIMLDESYIGTKVVSVSASLIKNSVQSFLDQKKRDGEIQDYDPEEVQVVINGEVARISLVIYPVRSLKSIEVSLVYKQQVLTS